VEFGTNSIDLRSRWSRAYDQELGDGERCLLLALLSFPDDVPLTDVKAVYRLAAKERGLPDGDQAFATVLAALQGSFLTIRRAGGRLENPEITGISEPSLRDFLKSRLLESPQEIVAMLARARFFEQVECLFDLAVSQVAVSPATWLEPLQDAARRTLKLASPALDVDEDYPGDKAFTILMRLIRLSEWREQVPDLSDFLATVVAEVAPGLLQRLPSERTAILKLWVELLVGLDDGGLEIDSMVTAVKDCAISSDERLVPFEVLVQLRALRPLLFAESEWNGLREDFMSWAEECLAVDGTDELDDLSRSDHEDRFWFISNKLERLEAIAGEMGLELDPYRLERAHSNAQSDYRNDEQNSDDFDGTYPLLEERP
jgi:hypothetical protein